VPPRVATGLDRVAGGDPVVLKRLSGRRLGLLAHAASVDARLLHARRVLSASGCEVAALFGPEHGFAADAQDMVGVVPTRKGEGGIPLHSLYGDTEESLAPRREWLDRLDAVVVDLQDVGSRYYTFVWTAALMLRAAAAAGVETVVLDRPNPLGGDIVEGAPPRPGHRSFVGLYDVSVRHGMTIGEICSMVRRVEDLDESCLNVVRMRGWRRGTRFDETGLPWVMPSPNMPTLDTARVYPGGCLLEGTNLSEGRGTTRPFEIWGAPFVDGEALSESVRADGAVLRALRFTPSFHKHANRTCGGVQVHVTDPVRFRSYSFYLRCIAAVRKQAGEDMKWRTEPYEFVSDPPAIDLLTGGPEFRTAVDAGTGLEEIIEAENRGAAAFTESRSVDLLY
jgi:uncharacterized protein YbbC (DUF1343 family)